MRLLLLFVMAGVAMSDEEWQPIAPETSISYPGYEKTIERSYDPRPQLKIVNRPSLLSNKLSASPYHAAAAASDTCSVHKVSMNQEVFYQFLEYKTEIPDLKEFTLCMWSKFHNHSDDHPLFSYSEKDSPKEILSWISNVGEASYFTMAIHGQTFFRLNYPLKLNVWYHSCQSWNGKTGEWQVWVNAERVGRGFHNRLVGHVIKGGGTATTGQDQSELYRKDGKQPLIKPGLMGEVTMLQLYHVALTAGKAHKDHKHHHAHHFKHDGTPGDAATEAVTEPPPPEATPLGNGNFLIGGQLQRGQDLNLANPPQQQMIPVQLPNGLQLQQEYINGQLGNRIISEQLLNSAQPISSGLNSPIGQQLSPGQIRVEVPQIQQFGITLTQAPTQSKFPARLPSLPKGTTIRLSSSLLNPANVQYIDDTIPHNLFRRDSQKRDKRDNPEKELDSEKSKGKKNKRGLVMLSDGSIVDDALLTPGINEDSKDEEAVWQQSLLSGLAGFVGNVPVQNMQKDMADEREPAEAEVKAVMAICDGCHPEPFKKALVLSWRSTPKKLYNGAHYYKGLPICKAF